jgi:hypothetical protein
MAPYWHHLKCQMAPERRAGPADGRAGRGDRRFLRAGFTLAQIGPHFGVGPGTAHRAVLDAGGVIRRPGRRAGLRFWAENFLMLEQEVGDSPWGGDRLRSGEVI